MVESPGDAGRGGPLSGTKQAVYEAVLHRPGMWVMRIARETDLSVYPVSVRLSELTREGLIETVVLGRRPHYFATASNLTEWEMRFLILLNSEDGWRLLDHVARQKAPRFQRDLREELGLTTESMRKHAALLVDLNIASEVAVPSSRRPGVGYNLNWEFFVSHSQSLLSKLPSANPEARILRRVLSRASL